MSGQISSLDEFWPFYVSQHLNPVNRRLHAVGTTLGIVLGAGALIFRAPLLLAAALVAAYACAWIGHIFYEKNRPATFVFPLLSLRADLRMYRLTVLGEMDTEILLLMKEIKRLRPG
jgi:hypothetical protein